MVFGEIVYVHVLGGVYDFRTGRIDISRWCSVGRLAANEYAHVHDRFEMKCPNEYKPRLISLSGP